MFRRLICCGGISYSGLTIILHLHYCPYFDYIKYINKVHMSKHSVRGWNAARAENCVCVSSCGLENQQIRAGEQGRTEDKPGLPINKPVSS